MSRKEISSIWSRGQKEQTKRSSGCPSDLHRQVNLGGPDGGLSLNRGQELSMDSGGQSVVDPSVTQHCLSCKVVW